MKVGVLDLGINNLYSIYNCFVSCGYKTKLVSNKFEKQDIDLLVLPGVGSFKYAMKIIKKNNTDEEIKSFLEKKNKFIYGICLGMQLFFEESNEFGRTKGLSLIKGHVKKFAKKQIKLVPNIGWHKVNLENKKKFQSLNCKNKYFYFVHSYFCSPKNRGDIFLSTKINNKFKFCSAIIKDNIIGTQFHPEKSGIDGINFIKNLFKKYEKN